MLRDARVSPDATSVTTAEGPIRLTLVPKLPLNRAWFDARSAAWFADQPVTIRGTRSADGMQARVLWPEAFRLGPAPAPLRTLPPQPFGNALRALARETSDADAPFQAATLWQRQPGTDWSGKSVLAFVLNGAQGDDDEAHAGHFAIATGRIADDGAIGEWLVNSFYALDTESEKGIIAAPVPLMNYQADLNAGQSWYRPTWILVAVLDDDRAARRVQSGLNRVFLHFWRHQLPYYHPTDNCTSMSVDTLRALGLDFPQLGPTSRIGAWLALPWLIARDRSVAKARALLRLPGHRAHTVVARACHRVAGHGAHAARRGDDNAVGDARPRDRADARGDRMASPAAVPFQPPMGKRAGGVACRIS